MNANDIVEKITSRNTHDVWLAACRVIDISQDRSKVVPLVQSLSKIKKRTKNLDMGGLLASNQRFVDFAIRVIEFHRDARTCPCCLYLEHGVDPNKEVTKENVTITTTVQIDGNCNWVDFYELGCNKCDRKYKVLEREHHFMWWKWTEKSA